jgi:hypothetical protein
MYTNKNGPVTHMGEAPSTDVAYVDLGGLFCRLRAQRVDHSNYRLGGPCIDELQDFQWGYYAFRPAFGPAFLSVSHHPDPPLAK